MCLIAQHRTVFMLLTRVLFRVECHRLGIYACWVHTPCRGTLLCEVPACPIRRAT